LVTPGENFNGKGAADLNDWGDSSILAQQQCSLSTTGTGHVAIDMTKHGKLGKSEDSVGRAAGVQKAADCGSRHSETGSSCSSRQSEPI
jgi:hypothetical protein